MNIPGSESAPLKVMQIGVNTSDMVGTLQFYADVFGFINAGATAAWGRILEIQGIYDAKTLMWWLIGRQPLVQFEIFHHTNPKQKPLPVDWRPSDIGWTRFGVSVPDFDRTMDKLRVWGVAPISEICTRRGGRRVAIRDPFAGVCIEIMEEAPGLPGGVRAKHFDFEPAIIYVAMSVFDLDAARRFYTSIMQLDALPLETLHDPEDEAIWGLPGASRTGFVVAAGDVFVEMVRYEDPIPRPRPADHLISDQGIMNVAFGTRDREVVQGVVDRLDGEGRGPERMFNGPEILGTYILDAEREVELFSWPPSLDAAIGFEPASDFIGAPRTLPAPIELRYRSET